MQQNSKDKYVYPFPSRFGSHASMVVAEETEKLGDPSLCVLRDEFGMYVTDRSRLDDRLADPARTASPEYRQARLEEALGQVVEIV